MNTKKSMAALLEQTRPGNTASTKRPGTIISSDCDPVKLPENTLRRLRLSKGIPGKEMVREVCLYYPRFDKMLLSKCERTVEYGIQIVPDAMDALIARFALELAGKKSRSADRHKNHLRIGCRLPENVYTTLIKMTQSDGYKTVQAWLEDVVEKYILDKGQDNG